MLKFLSVTKESLRDLLVFTQPSQEEGCHCDIPLHPVTVVTHNSSSTAHDLIQLYPSADL